MNIPPGTNAPILREIERNEGSFWDEEVGESNSVGGKSK
jgi:hypothetical protein